MKWPLAILLGLDSFQSGLGQLKGDFSFIGPKSHEISEYYDSHKKFVSQLCPAGTEEEFNKLYKNFRGKGWPVPLTTENFVDTSAIAVHLPALQKKIDWIAEQRLKLKENFNYQTFLEDRIRIETLISQALDYKTKIEHLDDRSPAVYADSIKNLRELRQAFRTMINHVPFLLTYGFPVDHLEDRRNHDELRESEDVKMRFVSNRKLLQRSLYEDGAQDIDHLNSDVFLRMAINTVTIETMKDNSVISENLRNDLEYILSGIDKQMRKGEKEIGIRLKEWEERTKDAINFYKEMEQNPQTNGNTIVHARGELQNFVNKKNAQVFKFLLTLPSKHVSLFVLETIFANEVGEMDSQAGLERQDVGRVVINRFAMPNYNKFGPKDALWPYLRAEGIDEQVASKNPWPVVLFKQGEFSFTYYFLSASVKTFCPDLSPRGKALRHRNLSIAWDLLDSSSSTGNAERYFSRASMKGRIDMASIWKNFKALPEKLGREKNLSAYWQNAVKSGQYRFLYAFNDELGQRTHVIVLNGEKVLWQRGKDTGRAQDRFFEYRDPDLFRYFSSK